MWVATSQSEDPCGSWWVYRLTFHGDPYPTGTMLDFPMLGQDTHALLISIRTCLRDKNCLDADFAPRPLFTLNAVIARPLTGDVSSAASRDCADRRRHQASRVCLRSATPGGR